jgi:DNA-binding CsgD family transcriptional regulator
MSRYLISSLLITIILAEYLTVTTLYYFLAGLGNYKRSRKITFLLIFWGITFGIGHIYSFWVFIKKSSEILFYLIHEFWIFSMLIFIFVMLIAHIFKSFSMSRIFRRPNLEFAIIFIIGYFFYSFDQVDFYFLKMRISLLSPLTLLCANVCPTVWLLLCFPKYFISYKESIADIVLPKSMNNFIREFNISGREGEIIEQIYYGRSNKEIEDILFISFSTVKNHISNIYQKTGVHSRSQLISLIRSLDKT